LPLFGHLYGHLFGHRTLSPSAMFAGFRARENVSKG
jgi:hypothetical protein